MARINLELMKIAFFGNTKYSVIDAEALHNKFGLVLIVTKPDKPAGRKKILTTNPVKVFAQKNNIPTFEANMFDKHTIEEIIRFAENDIGRWDFTIVADYGVILPTEVLQIAKIASLNIHHSLLPKYRGTSPAPAAILAGDKITGVTIIKMNEEFDSGDILAQKEYEMTNRETTDSLLTRLNELGGQLVCNVIKNYESLTPKPQDESKVTFTARMKKEDGQIDNNNPPDPQTLDRMIRAYFPWPTVWTKIDGKVFKLLPEGKIQPEGKRPMTQKEFSNGYGQIAEKIKNLLLQQSP